MSVTFLRAAIAVTRADFRERRRHYSFFLGLIFTAFLCYQAIAGRVLLTFDASRGLYSSAWVGITTALLANCSTLFAFYLVRNSVDRDYRTGVGQILAAAPLSSPGYILGKILSNCAVLASILAVFAAAEPLVQLSFGEDRALHLWQLYGPLLLLSMPAMAMTAAMAVSFELLPVLRTRVGNLIWFFLWALLIPSPKVSHRNWLDSLTGVWALKQMKEDASTHFANYQGFVQFNIAVSEKVQTVKDWKWTGIHWSSGFILIQLGWLVLAFVLPQLVGAISFRRFDPAQETQLKRWIGSGLKPNAKVSVAEQDRAHDWHSGIPIHLSPLERTGSGFGRLFAAELRLAYSSYRWWWYAVALGLLIAQFTAPLAAARGPILATAWLWSVLTWSAMGSREVHSGVRVLLFSCVEILPRQFTACFLVGLLTAIMSGTGVILRLAITGDTVGLLALLAGTVFLPSLAIALGFVTGSSKPFEALLALFWYASLNGVRGLDLTGFANGPQSTRFAWIDLGLAAACLITGFTVRCAQVSDRWRNLD